MKNILITGGAGFIGSNISLKLLDLGYNVTVLDSLSEQIHGVNPESSFTYNRIKNKVRVIKGCVTDKSLLRSILKNQQYILHLAAETGTGQSMYDIEKYSRVNILGTATLLEVIAEYKSNIKRVVVASSRSIYGEGKYITSDNSIVFPKHRSEDRMLKGDFDVYSEDEKVSFQLTDENSKLHPSSVYGITKLTQEMLVMNVCASLGLESVALRYQNVYGPGQSLSNPYTGILSIFSNLLLRGETINIFEDGKESRDFVFIDDVVDATIFSLENPKAANESFNVGSGVRTTVFEVAKTLALNYGVELKHEISGNFRLGDIRHNAADIRKAKDDLGFEARVKFDEGISKFTDWVKTQNIGKNSFSKSLKIMKDKGLLK